MNKRGCENCAPEFKATQLYVSTLIWEIYIYNAQEREGQKSSLVLLLYHIIFTLFYFFLEGFLRSQHLGQTILTSVSVHFYCERDGFRLYLKVPTQSYLGELENDFEYSQA